MGHYVHRYLVKLENSGGSSPEELKQEAVAQIRDFLELVKDQLPSDSYWIGSEFPAHWECPACICAAEVGPENFFKEIAGAVAARDKRVRFCMDYLRKAFPEGSIPLESLAKKAGSTEADGAFWFVDELLELMVLDQYTLDSYFFCSDGDGGGTNFLTLDCRADIKRHPENYFLVAADLHC